MPIDSFGCIKNTIKVAAGHYVDLADPQVETIDLVTIASALSKLCRFGCHCPLFYSVAEHCVHATALAARDGFTGHALQAILLHDAAEAYVGDVVKPLKVMLPDYAVVEDRMERVIKHRFGLGLSDFGDVVKRYDRIMLKAEKTVMWPEDAEEWFGFAETPDVNIAFGFWSPEEAETHFLSLAEMLGLFE